MFDGEVGRFAVGGEDASEVGFANSVREVVEDAIAGAECVDGTLEVVLFFEDVGVDGNIAYDLEKGSVVEWRVGGAKCSGKRVEVCDVLGSLV